MNQLVYSDQASITISVSDGYSKEYLDILDKTVWGTSGTLYVMHDLEREIAKFAKPHFVTLAKGGKPVAVCALNMKEVSFDNTACPACYVCLLSVIPEELNKGHASLLVKKTTDYFKRLLPDKGLIYAYVEKDNERSNRTFLGAGYANIGTFTAPVYSSFRPRECESVGRIKAEDAMTIIGLLKQQYKSHAFLDLESSFDDESYYVLKENGEIVAGMQVKRFRWSFLELPGLDGKMILKLFPHLPGIRGLFNPRNHEFLKIGNVYFKEGSESRIPVMIEALLARENLTTCMAYTNTRSPEHRLIANRVKHGLLSSVEAAATVYASFKGFSEEEIAQYQRVPLTISISDSI